MSLIDSLNHVNRLKKDLDSLRPLKKEDEERLWKKFRLEWNYNSNHLEGNTLTYGETQLLLLFDKTTGDHELREYNEMKAHDVAIRMVTELAEDKKRPLTEAFIRKLNEVILVEPYWKEAITPDGQATRRLIKIGEYKSYPNSVRLQNGEMFHYASPEETPALVSELMQWSKTNQQIHPVTLAATFHYKLVHIHPFDDGNGRTARLLMNYILLKAGYPPVIIKSSDKRNYFTALNKADVGDLDAFVQYIANQLVWSLEISIRAARGESVYEQGDFDKRVKNLYERQKDKIDIVEKSKNEIEHIVKTVYFPFIQMVDEQIKKMEPLFEGRIFAYLKEPEDIGGKFQMIPTSSNSIDEVFKYLSEKIAQKGRSTHSFQVGIWLYGYRKSTKKFTVVINFRIYFDKYDYQIKAEISEPNPSITILKNIELALSSMMKSEPRKELEVIDDINLEKWYYYEKIDQTFLSSKCEEIAHKVLDFAIERMED